MEYGICTSNYIRKIIYLISRKNGREHVNGKSVTNKNHGRRLQQDW